MCETKTNPRTQLDIVQANISIYMYIHAINLAKLAFNKVVNKSA